MQMQALLGVCPSSSVLSDYIAQLAPRADDTPDVKCFSDAVYFNYFVLGLSLLFAPQGGYRPIPGSKLSELNKEKLFLKSVDIYNVPPASNSARSHRAFSTFAALPLKLSLAAEVADENGNVLARPGTLIVTPESTGQDFVMALHEPDRKGGGTGPSSGSVGIWCEWSKDGIMVEFDGDGPQAWERGKDALWKVLTMFKPGSTCD
ncbi:hypothetical protein APHAL10511_006114 [Amanita phalloides]|nr:hypothetical protein APHAL10511_006114 [Amanita phalloides]